METQFKALLSVAIVSVVFLAGTKSQATLLKGYLQDGSSDTAMSAVPQRTASGIAGDNGTAQAATGELAKSDSFPESYEGTWRCVSYVTDSQVDCVPVGNATTSDISFVRNNVGHLVALWQQPGWKETNASVIVPSPTKANLDRTDYFFGQNMRGAWAARSRDQFQQTSSEQMVAQSYVDQYIDGQYVGRYHTKSVLVRLTMPAIANRVAFGGN